MPFVEVMPDYWCPILEYEVNVDYRSYVYGKCSGCGIILIGDHKHIPLGRFQGPVVQTYSYNKLQED